MFLWSNLFILTENASADWQPTLSEIISYVLGIGGLGYGVYNAISGRKTGKETVDVQRVNAKTNERDAATRATSMVVETLTEGLAEMRREAEESKARQEGLEKRIAEQDVKIENQNAQIQTLMAMQKLAAIEKHEILQHVVLLESMVADPPGPPARPWVQKMPDQPE